MRWLPLLALLTGCYEYDLNPLGETTNPGPEPGMGLLPGSGDIDTDVDDGPASLQGPSVATAGWGLSGAPLLGDGDDWWNEPWTEPPGPADEDPGAEDELESGLARMTGGGQVTDAFGTVSHTFTLHCAGTFDNHHLNVHLEDNSVFRLDDVDWVTCLDDPDVESENPERTFDTVVGVGFGSLDGEPADIWFRLVDGGEPSDRDTLWFQIHVGNDVVEGAGHLGQGNHQTHDPVGN